MADWNPEVVKELVNEREIWRVLFNCIKEGKVNFDDFFYNHLEELRNDEFDSGYSHALDNVETYVKESGDDIQYVLYLIQKERNTLNKKVVSI